METRPHAKAVRAGGEIIVLHCWACGTAHCVNLELCNPEELEHMVCSNSGCKMSMFLVSELLADREKKPKIAASEVSAYFAVLSKLWR